MPHEERMFGPYRLEMRLGGGGGGEVWRAKDTRLNRYVALKTMRPNFLADADAEERFRREAQLAAQLNHPNIVAVHAADEIDGQLYIDMQLVDGASVADLLQQAGPLDPDRATTIVESVAAALDHAHGVDGGTGPQMMHRDVKPGNILVARGRGHVYLADFGVARPVKQDAGLTASGQILGTPGYLAPELWTEGRLDHGIDVYALAVTTFEMLVGHRPFTGQSYFELMGAHLHAPVPRATAQRPDLPGGVDAVIARGMAKGPDDRYPTAGEFAADLREAVGPARAGPGRGVRRSSGGAALTPMAAATKPLSGPSGAQAGTPSGTPSGAPSVDVAEPAAQRAAAANAGPSAGPLSPAGPGPLSPARPSAGPVSPAGQSGGPVSPARPAASPAPPDVPPPARRVRRSVVLAALLLVVVLLVVTLVVRLWPDGTPAAGPAAPPPTAAAVLRLVGSDTIGARLAPALAAGFLADQRATDVTPPTDQGGVTVVAGTPPDKATVRFEIRTEGTETGFTALGAGGAEVAMASRQITAPEAERLAARGDLRDGRSEYPFALDAVAVVVPPGNPVAALTVDQLREIFTCPAGLDWSAFGGPPGPVHVKAMDDNSGTFETFRSVVLAGRPLCDTADRYAKSEELSAAVAGDPAAIGFVSIAFRGANNALELSDTDTPRLGPTPENVARKSYLMTRDLYLYVPTRPDDNLLAHQFVESFVLSSAGQEIVKSNGFVSPYDTPPPPPQPCTAALPAYCEQIDDAQRATFDVRFRSGDGGVDNRAVRNLDGLVDDLKRPAAQGRQVVLVGFADSDGPDDRNLELSRRRAEAVRDYLTNRGVPAVTTVGFGEALPVASNDNAEAKEQNRRVEVWLR